MESKNIINTFKKIKKLNLIKSKKKFINIKSNYILKKLFNNMEKIITLRIIKYNINMQKRLNININDYKDFSGNFSSIKLEIIPIQNKYGDFININEEEDKKYFHIYFNNNKKEIKKTELNKKDKVSKINIIIDYQIKSFKKLFYYCKCIESINFKQFNRNNITDMSGMFYGCSSLKVLNLSKFNINNVTNMSRMFFECSSLKELNLSNLNTNNVTNMSGMFGGCSSFKELKLSNFNTNNVTNMSGMFGGCSSLKKLNLSNFNTNNVTNMYKMFFECSSLKELNLSNFNTNNVTNMDGMFRGFSGELKLKIRSQYKNFQESAFL